MYGDDFPALFEQFTTNGRYIYSGPDFFVLAYPHVRESLLRRNSNKNLDKVDTWVIHYFTGEISRLFEIAPFDLEYVAFHRNRNDDKLKVYRMEDLKRRLSYGIRRSTKTTAPDSTGTDRDLG